MHDRDTNFRMIVVRLPLVTGNGIAVSTTRSIHLVLVERGRAKSSSSIEGKKKIVVPYVTRSYLYFRTRSIHQRYY